MAVPAQVTARDRAIFLLTALCERFTPRSEWRHTDVTEIVDVLIEAARAPESEHTRAVAEQERQRVIDEGDLARHQSPLRQAEGR